MTVGLSAIRVDDDMQVRAGINQQVVEEYAAKLRAGAKFPPIVVFADALGFYIADGNHRYRAHDLAGRTTIEVELRQGTKADALWYALGANKAHGLQLSKQDKRHAVLRAFASFPDRGAAEIADHVGCSAQWACIVRRGTETPSDRIVTRAGQVRIASKRAAIEAHQQIEVLLKDGVPSVDIVRRLRVGPDLVSSIKRRLNLGRDQSREAIEARRARIREMAAGQYTSQQIADAVGLTDIHVREVARRFGIDISADRAMGKMFRHDANRIVSRIVLDAENLLEGLGLIEYRDLERAQIPAWLTSLKKCREQLSTFIRRLGEEQSHNGEAA